MSYGYTCDWCGRKGERYSGNDPREADSKPTGWVEIKHGEHVCGICLDKGRIASRPKPPKPPKCRHPNRQYGPARGGAPSPYRCLDCNIWLD